MTLQGIVQRMKDAVAPDTEIDRLISAFLSETTETSSYKVRPKEFAAGRAILDADSRLQIDTLLRLSERASVNKPITDYQAYGCLHVLKNALLARTLPYTVAELEHLLTTSVPSDDPSAYSYYLLHQGPAFARAVQAHLDDGGSLTPTMQAALEKMRAKTASYSSADWRKATRVLDEALGKADVGTPDMGTPWADAAVAELAAMDAQERASWHSLLTHVAGADGSKPNAKWLAAGQALRSAVGTDAFSERVTNWLNKVTPPSAFEGVAPKPPTEFAYGSPEWSAYSEASGRYHVQVREYLGRISEKNIAMLKGLAWCAADVPSAELARALGRMTEAAFHSVRERGPWAKSAGNAAIWALGQMPDGVGVGPLARLRTKLRDRSALKLIAAGIESAAVKAGMTVDELEDLAVPTGGLDDTGTRQETFGEVGSGTLRLDAATGQTTIEWFGADGKPRKAVPAAVKAEFGAEVKALKAAEEEVKQALGAQAARLDRALLDERTWIGAEWRERYLGHPVLGNLTRRLLWTFDGVAGLPTGEGFVGADGQTVPLPDDEATVRLWHPIGHAPKDVVRWRDALEARAIVQPFKQAHREVYLLTDAERNTRTYSNRFAAHVLKQHQFNSLAVLRGWKNQLRLMVDDSYPPATKLLPQHNLRAEFWIEGIGDDYGTDTNEAGTYLRLTTDQVRFYPLDAATNYAHAGGGGYAPFRAAHPGEPLPLEQIPPLVLSEVMRDVDLFVGVASLGNDPNWADGGPQGRFRNYWHDYSFGELTETAKTRADVLGRLLPRLKIADRCRLDGRFLVVRGDLRTYKIHLGSGNILMEPNDQYLCIVPKSGTDEGGSGLMLPFEGDRMLSVIVSKAFLLAADAKITDPTITRQIGVHSRQPI